MSLTQYLTKPIARLALSTTLVLSPFFYDSRQEARAQDLGGLVDKAEKSEKIQANEYGDLRDYLFREDELPEGYKLIDRIYEKHTDSELNIVVYEKDSPSNKDEISKFGLTIVRGPNEKEVVAIGSSISIGEEASNTFNIPFLVKRRENKKNMNSMAVHLIFPINLYKLNIAKEYAEDCNYPSILQEINEKKSVLYNSIKNIIVHFSKIGLRLKKESIELKEIDNLAKFYKENH